MSYHHMNINQLTNIGANDYLGINAREGVRRMNIGKEFSKWKEIEQESKVLLEIYFSDPGALGQRGLDENSNSMIR